MSSFLNDTILGRPNSNFVMGHSSTIQEVNSIVGQIARTNVPVLVMGESGTGKEVYGRVIHQLSKHGHMRLKKVSCRAVEQTELFTLKLDLRKRVDNSADRVGTVFLDNIDELDLEAQKTLLSILPDGEADEGNFNRVRLIASTSRNLEKQIELGRFRRELYFRINGVCVHLPPLRDRKEDIHLFVDHFVAKHAAELGREVPLPNESEMEFLMMRDWLGNIRELENLTRRGVLLGDHAKAIRELRERPMLEFGHWEEPQSVSLKAAARTASRKAERDLISKALELTHWNRKRAAQQLQISYKSLLYKIKQTGLEEE